jgi:hypothetical protein
MFSLMLRKQVAELGGVTQSELDRSFEIKFVAATRVPERRDAVMPSVTRMLSEMLAFRPALATKVDAGLLRENADMDSDLPPAELAFLTRLFELCRARPDMRSIAESFRGDEFEEYARSTETGSLRWEGLDAEALEAEFADAWRRLSERFRHARIAALLEKSRQQGWTPEDKEQFRRLQQSPVAE